LNGNIYRSLPEAQRNFPRYSSKDLTCFDIISHFVERGRKEGRKEGSEGGREGGERGRGGKERKKAMSSFH
jgi:hypothetical protein